MDLAKSLRKITWKMVRGGAGRRARILTVQTKNGLISFSNADLVIGKGLYIGRAYEFDLMTQVLEHLRRSHHLSERRDLVIDVGAHVGMICIAMLRHGHFREALAFEPFPESFALLERNIGQNGLAGKIRPYRCALSDTAGELSLELSESNFGDHRLRRGAAATGELGEERRATVSVPVETLDAVIAREGIPLDRIGLLWVDIQGHEAQFFAGARRTLAGGFPVVAEFWPYGIRRAGLDAQSFTRVVESLFTRFVHVEPKTFRMVDYEVAALPRFFELFPGPHDHQQVIFFGRAA